MVADIIELGVHSNMSADDALGVVRRESPGEVLILYYSEEGEFHLRSSGMSNKDALWILEQAKARIVNEGLVDE